MTDFDAKAREIASIVLRNGWGEANRGDLISSEIAAALKAAYNEGVDTGGLAAMTASGHGRCDDCKDAVRAKKVPT